MSSWSLIFILKFCFIINSLQKVQLVEVECKFINYDGVYACEALNVFISDPGEDLDVISQHLSSFSNNDVKSMGFYASTVKTVCSGVFKVFPNLETLRVEGQFLKDLKKSSFKGAQKMKKLWLSNNIIERLESFVFSEISSLEGIRLGSNEISFISKNAFNGLNCLKKVDLQKNSLKILFEGVFNELINLREIRLNSNCIDVLKEGLFDMNQRLKKVFLENNKISKIDPKLFINHKFLEIVNLEQNTCIDNCFSDSNDTLENLSVEINSKCTVSIDFEKKLDSCNIFSQMCKQNVTGTLRLLQECERKLAMQLNRSTPRPCCL